MRKIAAIFAIFTLSGCAYYKFPANLTPQTGASVTGIFVPGSGWGPKLVVCIQKVDDIAMMYHGWGANECSYPVLYPPGSHKLIVQAYYMRAQYVGDVQVNANFVAGKAYFIHAESNSTPLSNGSNQMPALQDQMITVWIESASGVPATQKVQLSFAPLLGQNETTMLPMVPILMAH